MKKIVPLIIICFFLLIASTVYAYTINSGLKTYEEGEDVKIFASAYEEYSVEVYGICDDQDFKIVIYPHDSRAFVIEYTGEDERSNYKYAQFYVKKDQVIRITAESDDFGCNIGGAYEIAISRSIDCYNVTNYRGMVVNEDYDPVNGALVKTDWGGTDITDGKGRFNIIDCLSVDTISAQKDGTFNSVKNSHDNVIVLEGVKSSSSESGCFIRTLFQ